MLLIALIISMVIGLVVGLDKMYERWKKRDELKAAYTPAGDLAATEPERSESGQGPRKSTDVGVKVRESRRESNLHKELLNVPTNYTDLHELRDTEPL